MINAIKEQQTTRRKAEHKTLKKEKTKIDTAITKLLRPKKRKGKGRAKTAVYY